MSWYGNHFGVDEFLFYMDPREVDQNYVEELTKVFYNFTRNRIKKNKQVLINYWPLPEKIGKTKTQLMAIAHSL